MVGEGMGDEGPWGCRVDYSNTCSNTASNTSSTLPQ
jgi:hypothetical protein